MIPLADPEQLLPLHFKCWLYAEPAKLADHNAALAGFFRLKRGPTSRWTIDAVPGDITANSNQEGKVFVPLEVSPHSFSAAPLLAIQVHESCACRSAPRGQAPC